MDNYKAFDDEIHIDRLDEVINPFLNISEYRNGYEVGALIEGIYVSDPIGVARIANARTKLCIYGNLGQTGTWIDYSIENVERAISQGRIAPGVFGVVYGKGHVATAIYEPRMFKKLLEALADEVENMLGHVDDYI
jgi:hypothetical protein